MTAERPRRVFDGHNDLLLHAVEQEDAAGVFAGEYDTDLSIPAMRESGVFAGFFAAFVPFRGGRADPEETPDGYTYPVPDAPDAEFARTATYRAFEALHEAAAARDDVRVVASAADVDACADGDAVGVVPHVEGASGVRADLSNLDFLYAAGLRSVGPVWSRPNQFGHGVPFERPGHPDADGRPGLTDAGERLVAACSEKGIVVDGSHMNAAELRDAIRCYDGPLAVTHTAAHGLVPHSRNLTDDQLHAVADTGGVVGVTYAAAQLAGSSAVDATATLADVADHVAYVAEEVGVDHVALGSDFDGARLVTDLDGVTGVPDLVAELETRGFGADDLERICWANWRDLLADVL